MNPHNIPIFIPNLYKFNLFMIHKCSKLIIISKMAGKLRPARLGGKYSVVRDGIEYIVTDQTTKPKATWS
jgi:hypothetical protein